MGRIVFGRFLEELKKIEDVVINENIVQSLLDTIYEPFELNDDSIREKFRGYLDNLYPYNVYEESEEEFFSQFDGIDVLPIELKDEFTKFIEKKQYLEAEKLFVSISKKRYMANRDKITFFEYDGYKRVFPIIALQYYSDIGLTNDEVKEINGKSIFSWEL